MTHRCTETATTNCTAKFSKGLPNCTGGVKAFSQQDYTVQEEEGGQAIDNVLKILNTTREREKRHVLNKKMLKCLIIPRIKIWAAASKLLLTP